MADEQSKKKAVDREDPQPGMGEPEAGVEAESEEPETAGSLGEEVAGADEAPDEGAYEAGSEPESDEPKLTITRQRLNRYSMGTLTVHYRTRSVSYSLDGESAIRLLAVLVGHRHNRTLDVVDPENASAFQGWVMVDSTEVIGADWNPLPEPSRIAVDPPNVRPDGISRLLYEGRISEEDVLGVPISLRGEPVSPSPDVPQVPDRTAK